MTTPPDAGELLRDFMRRAPQLVTVVTARGADGPRGITVSSFVSVSLEPPLVLVSIAVEARAHEAIAAGRFRVHLMGEDQRDVSNHFARPGLGSAEQFAGAHAEGSSPEGAPPRLDGCIGWLDCEVASAHREGDHTLFIGRIVDAAVERPDAAPLVYQNRGYRRLEA